MCSQSEACQKLWANPHPLITTSVVLSNAIHNTEPSTLEGIVAQSVANLYPTMPETTSRPPSLIKQVYAVFFKCNTRHRTQHLGRCCSAICRQPCKKRRNNPSSLNYARNDGTIPLHLTTSVLGS